MMFLHPNSPYQDTFVNTALAIDEVSHETPIYDGNNGPERTAIELIAVSYWESSFDPNAVGHDSWGESLGLAQIHESNMKGEHVTRAQLFDQKTNLRIAAKMMRESHRICKKSKWLYQLAEYATGRAQCNVAEGMTASFLRLSLAQTLLQDNPPYWREYNELFIKHGSGDSTEGR